ncbi:DUF3572 domain-containing protein [Phaeovulum vinaykumarii]|uniref:DUF3572 family protein n=1 Tax=Phaeovulum vinaykumarii TaxID=407234 RepID=A0A1N7KW50_9RHOB|nr:DUF3572 domain-containing protein [Phaeovulum vinaykumarii]SIS65833.1 Protein of unknown function [Phaeovulum vinaykumarii]SOC01174.1 uncharacterized protein DUF3572 [Phaeovulum vinaykumarii]
MRIGQDTAEDLAASATIWLAGDPEIAGGFLSATGLAPEDLAQVAGDRGFLLAVLDYLLQRDDWVLAFARDQGIDPALPMLARQVLAGRAGMNWT